MGSLCLLCHAQVGQWGTRASSGGASPSLGCSPTRCGFPHDGPWLWAKGVKWEGSGRGCWVLRSSHLACSPPMSYSFRLNASLARATDRPATGQWRILRPQELAEFWTAFKPKELVPEQIGVFPKSLLHLWAPPRPRHLISKS